MIINRIKKFLGLEKKLQSVTPNGTPKDYKIQKNLLNRYRVTVPYSGNIRSIISEDLKSYEEARAEAWRIFRYRESVAEYNRKSSTYVDVTGENQHEV